MDLIDRRALAQRIREQLEHLAERQEDISIVFAHPIKEDEETKYVMTAIYGEGRSDGLTQVLNMLFEEPTATGNPNAITDYNPPAINAVIPTTKDLDTPHDRSAEIDRKFAVMSDEEYVASLKTSGIAVIYRNCDTCGWVEDDNRCAAPESCQDLSAWKAKETVE